MGISDIQKVTAELTALPIVVRNWQFKDVLGMDTAFNNTYSVGEISFVLRAAPP